MNVKKILVLIVAIGFADAQASIAALKRVPARVSRAGRTAATAGSTLSRATASKALTRSSMASKATAAAQEPKKAPAKPVSVGQAAAKGLESWGGATNRGLVASGRNAPNKAMPVAAKAQTAQPQTAQKKLADNNASEKYKMHRSRYGLMNVDDILALTPSVPKATPAQTAKPVANVQTEPVASTPVAAEQVIPAVPATPVIIDVEPAAVKTVKNKPAKTQGKKAVKTPPLAQLPRILGRPAPQKIKPVAVNTASRMQTAKPVSAVKPAIVPSMHIPRAVSHSKRLAVTSTRNQTPMVARVATPRAATPIVNPIAGLTPRIQPLAQSVDVFAMPERPKLISESSMALVPYAAVNAVRAAKATRTPAYTLHVPAYNAQESRAHYSTASQAFVPSAANTAVALVPRYSDRGQGRGYSRVDGDSGYSWMEKALMTGAAAGAAGLMLSYANQDSKDLVEDRGELVVQNQMQELFPYFRDAVNMLAQQLQDQIDGIIPGQSERIEYENATVALKKIHDLAQKQGLMPYLIEESEMPAYMQMDDPHGVQVLRLEDKAQLPALHDGQNHEHDDMRLVQAKDKKNKVAAIISGNTIRMAVGLDNNGQKVYKRFYLAFINPELMNLDQPVNQKQNKPLVGFLMSAKTREMLALNQPRQQAALPAPQPVDVEDVQRMGMPVQPAYSGGFARAFNPLLRGVEPAVQDDYASHVPFDVAAAGFVPEAAQYEAAFDPMAGHRDHVPLAMSEPSQAEQDDEQFEPLAAQPAKQASLSPVKWAIKEYGEDILHAVKNDMPLQNLWARGSTELIDMFNAYNAMRNFWANDVKTKGLALVDRTVEERFEQCRRSMYKIINGIAQSL